jgi:hypothetical protein
LLLPHPTVLTSFERYRLTFRPSVQTLLSPNQMNLTFFAAPL